jgi:hypothetical protein
MDRIGGDFTPNSGIIAVNWPVSLMMIRGQMNFSAAEIRKSTDFHSNSANLRKSD